MPLPETPTAPHPGNALPAHANPVLPGFFPDPSIVRVGADYYLVHSTFQYFPAIVISHSRDLVQWRQIGHVFNSPDELDLTHFLDGCGIWAPDISHHGGYFYIFFCLVQLTPDRSTNERGNYMVRSRSILGPYSKPVQLTREGNDPSHFVDRDGSHHLVYAAGIPRGKGVKLARLNDDCTAVIGEPAWLEFEPEKRAPEGPHLLFKNGHYYLTLAAGGGIYSGHHQLIARSRSLLGPYEAGPDNPFIVERTPNAACYHHGHAKLFQAVDGAWWCVYLLRRRVGGFSQLGRETALDRVDWQPDGWPVLNGGAGPSDRWRSPSPTLWSADFGAAGPGVAWYTLRRPAHDAVAPSPRPDCLRLRGGTAGLDSRTHVGALLRRETCHDYTATTCLRFTPRAGAEAGLVCYYDTDNHLKLAIVCDKAPRLRLSHRVNGVETVLADLPAHEAGALWLRVEVRGLARSFSCSNDGETWIPVGTAPDCSGLSDEGTSQWGFTGTMVGLYARRGPDHSPLQADFDGFLLREGAALGEPDRHLLLTETHANV